MKLTAVAFSSRHLLPTANLLSDTEVLSCCGTWTPERPIET